MVETRKGKNIEGCRFKELYIQGRICICCIGNLICVLKLRSGIPKKNLNLVPCLEHIYEKFVDSMHQCPIFKMGTDTIGGMLNPSSTGESDDGLKISPTPLNGKITDGDEKGRQDTDGVDVYR